MSSSTLAALQIRQELRLRGPTAPSDLKLRTTLSPATFTRAMSTLRPELLTVGATRAQVVALRREIPGLPAEIPIYELLPGQPRLFGTLIPVEPKGFFVRSPLPVQGFYDDLPWFLNDLRPEGFLGRLQVLQKADPELPADARMWSGSQLLRWLARWGVDMVGSFVIGDAAFLRTGSPGLPTVASAERAGTYGLLAQQAMTSGVPGSSAAGEQPKFLTIRRDEAGDTPVLVKFSPPLGDRAACRVADLLRAEHHSLGLLRELGIPAARTALIRGNDRLFLEVERFDRPAGGRRGVVALSSVAGWAGAALDNWTAAAEDLGALLNPSIRERMRWLDIFGALIGNTDRHAGNLSFFFDEGRIGDLTPVYDMLPMRYYPRAGEFSTPPLLPPPPSPRLGSLWPEIWTAAATFWRKVEGDPEIDNELRRVAGENAGSLEELFAGGRPEQHRR